MPLDTELKTEIANVVAEDLVQVLLFPCVLMISGTVSAQAAVLYKRFVAPRADGVGN